MIEYFKTLRLFLNLDTDYFNWISRRKTLNAWSSAARIVTFWRFLFEKYSLAYHGNVADGVVFYSNDNEKNIISPIVEHLLCIDNTLNIGVVVVERKHLFLKIIFTLYLPFILPVLLTKGVAKLDIRIKALFYFHLCRIKLSRAKCKFAIQANDHNLINNCFFYAAKSLRITTVYIQHADVSAIFPPLRHDMVFLDGDKAKDIYERCGISNNSKIILAGCQRKYHLSKIKEKKITLGLGLTPTDDISVIMQIFKTVLEEFDVVVRVHPRFKNKISFKNLDINGFDFSYEDLPRFFSRISLLFSCPSSLILDASVNKINCCQLSGVSSNAEDYYDFAENGLCDSLNLTEDNLKSYLDNYDFNSYHFFKGLSYYDKFAYMQDHLPSKFVAEKIIQLLK